MTAPRSLAVIADIHGNVNALRAVLADIDGRGLTEIVNLGDHFSGPLAAAETADILLGRSDIQTIRGNHDRQLLEQKPDEMGPSDRAAHDQLSPAHLAWLRTLAPRAMIGGVAFACHGTPSDDATYWCETVAEDGTVSMRPMPEIAGEAAILAEPILLCAHSHLPRVVGLPTGQTLVNPGSVGCPAFSDDMPAPHAVETGEARASWAEVIRDGSGWRAELRLTEYDPARMVALARAAGREDWAEALMTGRVTAPADGEPALAIGTP